MKFQKLKSLISILTVAAGIVLFNPSSASAAWKNDSYGWWNTEGSSYSTGWRNIDNTWYYFGSDGYMRTGWTNDNGTWYFLADSGAMKTGWVNVNGSWYYLDNSGAMKTGWINDNGTWYYTNENGAMQTGLLTINNNTYYLNQSGAMVTGDIAINGVKYTFASTGEKISATSIENTSTKNVDNNNDKNTNTTDSSTSNEGSKNSSSGGGGGKSSSTKHDSNKFAGYSDLYGTWTIDSYVKAAGMNTNLSDAQIEFIVGLNFTVSKDKIYYDALINTSNPTVRESVLTNSEFKNKFGTSISNLGISGDKVNCITISSKDNSNKTKTGYVIVSSNNEVYAIVKGAAFKLKKA